MLSAPAMTLPKSSKVETLPPDLRRLADKMLKQKFPDKFEAPKKKPVEPEVLDSFTRGVHTFNHSSYVMYSYRARPVGKSPWWEHAQRNAQYQSVTRFDSMEQFMPKEQMIQFSVGQNEDPMIIAERLKLETDKLEQRTGYTYKLERA